MEQVFACDHAHTVRYFRAARLDEDEMLSGLTRRAIGSWGYDANFMVWADPALTLTSEIIATQPIFVLEEEGRAAGFYGLRGNAPEVELRYMMVEPAHQRTGHGRRLWQHAAETARRLGASVLTVDSDPFAIGFYRSMGAVVVGQRPWSPLSLPTWRITMLRFDLSR